MDSLDKIIIEEANKVTPDDYKKLTGTSLEESMARMKENMAEVKARVAKTEKAKETKQHIVPLNMQYAMPMAASAQEDAEKKNNVDSWS